MICTQLKHTRQCSGEQEGNIPDAAELGPRYQSAALNTDLLRPLGIGAEGKLRKQYCTGLSLSLMCCSN